MSFFKVNDHRKRIEEELKELRKVELRIEDHGNLQNWITRAEILHFLIFTSKRCGDFEICKTYAKEMSVILPFIMAYFPSLSEFLQATLFDCSLICCEFMCYNSDEKDTQKRFVEKNEIKQSDEILIDAVIEYLENPIEDGRVHVTDPKRSEIIGRAYTLKSKLMRMKIRHSSLVLCPKIIEKAKKYLKPESHMDYFLLLLYEESSYHLEHCGLLDRVLKFLLMEHEITTHDTLDDKNTFEQKGSDWKK